MATLTYSWQNYASWTVTVGQAKVTFWVDAKLSSQNTSGNYSVIDTRLTSTKVTGSMSGTGYNFQLTGASGKSGSAVWYYSNETILTGQFTHNHNANGTATNVNIHAWVSNTYLGFGGSIDAYVTLPTINRQATLTTAVNFNDEENPTIKFSNPGGFRINARLEFGGTAIRRDNIANTGTYTFVFTDEERALLRSKATSNTLTVREVIATCYSGTTESVWSFADKTMTVINANPIFENFEYEDVNNTTLALTGNNKTFVLGYSNIQAIISTTDKAIAQKEATMSKYTFTIGDTVVDNIPYSEEETVTSIINNANGSIFNVYATDSRNNSTIVNKIPTSIIQYQSVYIDKQNTSVTRNNNQVGTNVIITLNGTFWNDNFGLVTNSVQVSYKFKKTDSDVWLDGTTTITPTIDGNNYTFAGLIASDNQDTTWDLDASYNIKIIVEDELSITEYEMILNSGIPTLSLDKEGVGVMCAYDTSKGGYLQVKGEPIGINEYSTNEIKTNKVWLNDEPIYRTVYTGTIDSREIEIDGPTGISQVVSFSGVIYSSYGQWWGIPCTYSNTNYLTVPFYVASTNKIKLATGTYYDTNSTYYLIVEYTKTTNQN